MGSVSLWKVPQKKNRHTLYFLCMVRVKTCGKSARHMTVMPYAGKPYPEQGKIGVDGSLFRLETRVCRLDK